MASVLPKTILENPQPPLPGELIIPVHIRALGRKADMTLVDGEFVSEQLHHGREQYLPLPIPTKSSSPLNSSIILQPILKWVKSF